MGKIRIKDENYLYGSTRVRARAVNGINNESLLRMADAPGIQEALRIVSERGINIVSGGDGSPDVEATLEGFLKSEFDVVRGFTADPQIYNLIRYTYDAHNLKSAVKNEIRSSNDSDILIDLGSVKASEVTEAAASRDFGAFPRNMACAALKAIEDYDKTSDPQVIDLVIDRACYADMLDTANSFNKKFFAETVKTKIDTTNILTSVRVIRMGLDHGYFESCYIEGGKLGKSFFKKLISSGQESFRELLSSTDYSYISDTLEIGGRMSEAELVCENCYIEKLRDMYAVPYGAEVTFAYLALTDIAIRNVRIILTAKKVGLAPAEIRKKLRGIR